MQIAALRSRDFRVYWMALIVSSAGTWMQIVAQSLLVLRISHGNATPLGFVALAQASAFFLFAPTGGSFADRMDRRRLLLITQSSLMVIAFVIGMLVIWHKVQIWMIVGGAFLSGVFLSFDQPARSTFLPSLVPEPALASAISLQSSVFTGAGAVAPVLAGLSIAHFGLAANFFFNAASYLVAVGALLLVRNRYHVGDVLRISTGWRESIQHGVRTVGGDSLLKFTVSGYAVLLLAAPSMQIFLPVLVAGYLRFGPSLLGVLFAAFGAGTIGGALMVPWLAHFGRTRAIYLACFAIWVIALLLIGSSSRRFLLIAWLLCLGAAQGAIGTMVSTLLQSSVEKNMRGRMMSLQTLLNMGIRPLGDFPLSFLIAGIGAPAAAAVSAAIVGGYGVYLAVNKGCREVG